MKKKKKQSGYFVSADTSNGFELFMLGHFPASSLYSLRKSTEIELFSRITDLKNLTAFINNAHFHDPADNVSLLHLDTDLLLAIKKAITTELEQRNINPVFTFERAENKDLEKKVLKETQLEFTL